MHQGGRCTIIDPLTGLPFPGNTIPRDRISPQAAALLGYYPQPTLDADGRYNYEAPILSVMRQESVQSRLTQTINQRNQVFGTVSYQRTTTNADNAVRLRRRERIVGSGCAGELDSPHRAVHVAAPALPVHAARRTRPRRTSPIASNVSGDAGITGNNQEPVNWGPPSLSFSSGIAGLI